MSPSLSSITEAREVALLMASIGDIPRSTIRENSCAIGSDQEMPPISVPKTILTPAFMAFLNETAWASARLRSRLPSGVSSAAQSL